MVAGSKTDSPSPDSPVGQLEQIEVDKITPNERNPRQTFDQPSIERLAASLEEIGLQVPITVYRDSKKASAPYVLLDGERRFKAAKLINWQTIPALVVPRPSLKDNAVRMFNIHMLREDWREIETAWALEQIIQETGIENDRVLQKLTGLAIDRIRNMKRVLGFPKSVQEKVGRGDLPYQLLVELDKNLLSKRRDEIRKDETQIVDASVAELRDVFLKKFTDEIEKDIVDLRKVGTLFDTARGRGKVAERAKVALKKLVKEPSATIEDAYDAGAASSIELSRVLKDLAAMPGRIRDLLAGNLEPDERQQVKAALVALRGRLDEILKKAKLD